jgi:hypothetical protein
VFLRAPWWFILFFSSSSLIRSFSVISLPEGSKKGVGVAENPRSGVGARGSSVKKGRTYGEICYTLPPIALPLLGLLTVIIFRENKEIYKKCNKRGKNLVYYVKIIYSIRNKACLRLIQPPAGFVFRFAGQKKPSPCGEDVFR